MLSTWHPSATRIKSENISEKKLCKMGRSCHWNLWHVVCHVWAVSVQHSWKTFDPQSGSRVVTRSRLKRDWIGGKLEKVFNFMVWQLYTRTRMTRREVLSVIRTKLSPEWHSHSSHSVWDHRMWWLKMLLMIYCKFAFYDMWAGHIIWPMSDKMISMGTFR